MNPALRKNDFLEVISGILLASGLHLFAIVVGISIILGANAVSTWGGAAQMLSVPITYFSMLALILLGLTQFIYIVPVSAWLREQRKMALRQGVLTGAMFTVFLNIGYLVWLGLLLR